MKSFLEEDKEVRYFPNDSEMPILIHYLQVYFSHPERSIQRSQVVQSVVSILSGKNKHWNHRTVRLWFNNNKRIFFRPPSQITQPQVSKEQLPPRHEQHLQSPPNTPYYIPARPLSVVQLPTVPARPPSAELKTASPHLRQIPTALSSPHLYQPYSVSSMPQLPTPPLSPIKTCMPINMNPVNQVSPQPLGQINQLQPMQPQLGQSPYFSAPPSPTRAKPPKPGSFAILLNSETDSLAFALGNKESIEPLVEKSEKIITEKIYSLYDQRWTQITAVQPSRTSIIDTDSVEQFYSNPAIASVSIEQSPRVPALQTITNFDMIDSSVITPTGEPAVISWDIETQSQRLHFRGNTVELNSINQSEETEQQAAQIHVSNAKSIIYNGSTDAFWVHSGRLICPYLANNLLQGPNISTHSCYSEKSAMTFWKDNLVLATGSIVKSWSAKYLEKLIYESADSHESLPKKSENSTEISSDRITASSSDDTDSILNAEMCFSLKMPTITSVTTVDENLVIASTEHHTAQVYATNGALFAECIGHTSGITCLHTFDDNSFLSGSADQTAKYWDIRVQVPVFSLLRHRGIVTSVYGCGDLNPYLIFTGGVDGVVRAWDIRELRHVFSIPVGEGSPISIGMTSDLKKLTVVTSERATESFYDLGKYGPKLDRTLQQIDAGPNSLLEFLMPE